MTLVLVLSLGFSIDVSGNFRPSSIETEYGTGQTINLTITNNEVDEILNLNVELTGIPTWMRVIPSSFELFGGQTKTLKFFFSNQAPPASYIYTARIKSNNTIVWDGNIIIGVTGEGVNIPTPPQDQKYIYIHTQKDANPGETIIITLDVSSNLVPSDADITLLKDGDEVVKVSETLDKTQKSFTLTVPNGEQAGQYMIQAYLAGKEISNQTRIDVTELNKVEISKETKKKLLGKEVVLIAKNIGNTFKEGEVTAQISVFDRPLLNAEPAPEVERDGFSYTLKWDYKIAPGDERIVASYTVDYIPYSIIGVLVIIAILLMLQRPEAVEVKKSFEQTKGHEKAGIKVTLTLINSSDETVEGVVVEDLVPGIARVKKAFIVKPKAKKERAGTNLIWDIGKLAPGEERILSYEAELSFGIIGKLELPKPKVNWHQ
ncbi:MAG: hypothetical protein GOU98_00180 [Candidatus Altiarchaeota archaeon]|nr:hypothetical protein [Candidatus Altiarchaeota archaeon]